MLVMDPFGDKRVPCAKYQESSILLSLLILQTTSRGGERERQSPSGHPSAALMASMLGVEAAGNAQATKIVSFAAGGGAPRRTQRVAWLLRPCDER